MDQMYGSAIGRSVNVVSELNPPFNPSGDQVTSALASLFDWEAVASREPPIGFFGDDANAFSNDAETSAYHVGVESTCVGPCSRTSEQAVARAMCDNMQARSGDSQIRAQQAFMNLVNSCRHEDGSPQLNPPSCASSVSSDSWDSGNWEDDDSNFEHNWDQDDDDSRRARQAEYRANQQEQDHEIGVRVRRCGWQGVIWHQYSTVYCESAEEEFVSDLDSSERWRLREIADHMTQIEQDLRFAGGPDSLEWQMDDDGEWVEGPPNRGRATASRLVYRG